MFQSYSTSRLKGCHQNEVNFAIAEYEFAIGYEIHQHEIALPDAEFDALLDEALATPDVDARREIMANIQQKLRDSGIIVHPYWRSVYRNYRTGVHGCEQHQALEQNLERVWIEA